MSHPTSLSASDVLTESPARKAALFLQRIVAHVRGEFARQHRLFVFQVILVKRSARFVRWDRSGAVITERFDYVANPETLAEFLWRFNHMSDEQRGFDPTATPATPKEKKRFEDAMKKYLAEMKIGSRNGVPCRPLPGAEFTLDETKTCPTWKIHLTDTVSRKAIDL